MKTKRMQIVFESENSQIDANTLINVLKHYQTVINIANKEYGDGVKTIDLKVNAIEKGSFIIDISIVENLKQIFTGENIGYIANLGTIISGIFGVYKLYKGNPVKSNKDKENVTIAINGNGNNVSYTPTIINVYNQQTVREAISKSIEAVDADTGVEGLRIDTGSKNPVTFKRKNFKEYIYDDFDQEQHNDEKISVEEATLIIVGLNFESGSRWQFIYNGYKITARIKDEALMQKIDAGERFGKGDAIRVKLQILQRYNPEYNAYEIKSYKIIEFLGHIEAPKQRDLFGGLY